MSNFHYKHIQGWEKQKLEKLIQNNPIAKPIYGISLDGRNIVDYEWLVDIKYLSFKLGREPKTIKNELLRGSYWTLTNRVDVQPTTYSYSKATSDRYHRSIINKRSIQNTKILLNQKLQKFVTDNLDTQSLKGIGGRSQIAFKQGLIEQPISHTTLYNYINNIHVDFIDNHALKRRRKQHYRLRYIGKRQNGVSINERPVCINNRHEFGHWEMDLIEGKRGTNVNLLTMSERKTKMGIAIKINGKEANTITKTLKALQSNDVLVYGSNVLSITPDNGSEFWGWETFKKSIHNSKDDIDVFFTNPYCSWEKGGVENFNGLIRTKFPKGTDFSLINDQQIKDVVNWINNIFRGSLGFRTASEVYNQYVQN